MLTIKYFTAVFNIMNFHKYLYSGCLNFTTFVDQIIWIYYKGIETKNQFELFKHKILLIKSYNLVQWNLK